MANMAYCRFENTLGDLEDCKYNMDESKEDLGKSETEARRKLIELCVAIAEEYGDEISDM